MMPSAVIINCTLYGEVSNFSMSWRQPRDMRDFTVIVYPNQTFNNTTPITFQYEHAIPFTISITQHDCTEDIITIFHLSMLFHLSYPYRLQTSPVILVLMLHTYR